MSDEAAAVPSVEGVHRVEFDVEWPPGHAVAWLVDGPEPTLVDAGAPGEDARETLTDRLANFGYGLADVEHLVVTHPHSDHIGQVPALAEAGATVYAPRAALDQLRRDVDDLRAAVRASAREAGIPGERVGEAVEQAVDSLERDRRLLEPAVDVAVEFGEPFDVCGYEVTPVHTPGHQRTHASYTVALDEPVLFSGDALIEPFRAAAIHAGIDVEAYDAVGAFYEAMDRFEAVTATRAFPGHGPAFDDVAGAVAATRADLDELVAETAAALAAVEPAPPALVSYERAGETDHPAPLLDTLGALGYLDAQGRATYDLAEGVRQYRLLEG